MKTRSTRRPPRRTIGSREALAANCDHAGTAVAVVVADDMQPDGARRRGFSAVQRTLCIWIGIVFCAVAWQPFLLGFYSDDWPFSIGASHLGAPFSKARWIFALKQADPTRPGLAPLRYLFSSLCGDQALLWHGALLLGNILVAISIFKLLIAITETRNPAARAIAIAAASCWLLFPWNQAANYWPTMLPAVIALAVEGFLCAYLIDGWKKDRSRAVAAALVYLWMCVSYEAFYLQWAALLLMAAVLLIEHQARLRTIALTAAGLLVAQGAALWWWHYGKSAYAGRYRPVLSSPGSLVAQGISRIGPAILTSMSEISWIVSTLAIVVVAFWTVACFRSFRIVGGERSGRRSTMLFAGASLVAAFVSVVVYTVGGRTIVATGLETRSLYVFNFWVIIAAAILTMFAFERLSRVPKRVFAASVAMLGLCLAVGQVMRAGEWATAARLQNHILRHAPADELKRVEPGSHIVFVNTREINGAPVLSSSDDLQQALPWMYPYLRNLQFTVYDEWVAPLVWQNGVLAYQSYPPIYRGQNVYVWRPSTGDFYKAGGPFIVDQSMNVRPLNR